MSRLTEQTKTLAPRTRLFRLSEQVKPLTPLEGPREYRADVPTTFPRPVFRSTESHMDAEALIRKANPLDSAYGLESQAQALREAARRETDPLLRAADERRADNIDAAAVQQRQDARALYEASATAIAEAAVEQQRFLEDAIRRTVSFDVLSRELLLNKADQLLAMGRADEARIYRASVHRGDTDEQ